MSQLIALMRAVITMLSTNLAYANNEHPNAHWYSNKFCEETLLGGRPRGTASSLASKDCFFGADAAEANPNLTAENLCSGGRTEYCQQGVWAYRRALKK